MRRIHATIFALGLAGPAAAHPSLATEAGVRAYLISSVIVVLIIATVALIDRVLKRFR